MVLVAGLGAVADADDGGVVLGEAHDAPLPRRLRARADFQHVAACAVRRAVRCGVLKARGLDNSLGHDNWTMLLLSRSCEFQFQLFTSFNTVTKAVSC